MRVTFIRPNMMPGLSEDAMEPLVFAILNGLTPPEIDRRLYDERIESIPFDEPTDLVALTVDTYSARRSYQIAAEYHQRGVPVVMGGYHPTLQPREASRFAASMVIGDAETVWPRILTDAANRKLLRVYEGSQSDLSGICFDRRIFEGKRYRPVSLVQWGRGCPFACDFCSVHSFYPGSIRHRPLADVLEDIRRARRRHIFFADDNLLSGTRSARGILDALRPLKRAWSCQTSLDVAADRSFVRRMADSGCFSVTVGFESLDPANLRQMGKTWNQASGSYKDQIAVFRDAGIRVYGTFLFGYDHDTPDTFDRVVDFAQDSKLFMANFNPLTPFPGTPLYQRLRRERRLLLDPWWLDPGYRYGSCVFHPAGMTADQLTAGCYRARQQFNGFRSIFRRALDTRANTSSLFSIAVYLAANHINGREIRRKQSRPLGETTAIAALFESTAPCD